VRRGGWRTERDHAAHRLAGDAVARQQRWDTGGERRPEYGETLECRVRFWRLVLWVSGRQGGSRRGGPCPRQTQHGPQHHSPPPHDTPTAAHVFAPTVWRRRRLWRRGRTVLGDGGRGLWAEAALSGAKAEGAARRATGIKVYRHGSMSRGGGRERDRGRGEREEERDHRRGRRHLRVGLRHKSQTPMPARVQHVMLPHSDG